MIIKLLWNLSSICLILTVPTLLIGMWFDGVVTAKLLTTELVLWFLCGYTSARLEES